MEVAVNGSPLGAAYRCPDKNCRAQGSLHFTATWVDRIIVWLVSKVAYREHNRIPLARCGLCKKRCRVLPIDVLPQKIYSLPLITQHLETYPTSKAGLRPNARSTEGDAPHFSTIFRWTAAMGERALDRIKYVSSGDEPPRTSGQRALVSTAALIAESTPQDQRNLFALWQVKIAIPPFKYHTQKRAEQLEACARVFLVARTLQPNSENAFLDWHVRLTRIFHVPAWDFPSSINSTRLQQIDWSHPAVDSSNRKFHSRNNAYGARSPPDRRLEV